MTDVLPLTLGWVAGIGVKARLGGQAAQHQGSAETLSFAADGFHLLLGLKTLSLS